MTAGYIQCLARLLAYRAAYHLGRAILRAPSIRLEPERARELFPDVDWDWNNG
jgi:hypothetical protein